jgi:hypothetical protein
MLIAILGAVASIGLLAWGNARRGDDPGVALIQSVKRSR